MDQAAGEGGGEEGEEEHTEQQSQRIQVATACALDLGAVGEIYRGDILGPPPPPHQHISLIVSSKGAIWGDDSEDLRFIVLHGELRSKQGALDVFLSLMTGATLKCKQFSCAKGKKVRSSECPPTLY